MEFEARDVRVVAGNDVAFYHALERMSGTLKGGEKFAMWVRATSCLKKIHGRWLIVHDHISVRRISKPGRPRWTSNLREVTDLQAGPLPKCERLVALSNVVMRAAVRNRTENGVAIAPNGARAYVANETAATVSVIDTATNTARLTDPANIINSR